MNVILNAWTLAHKDLRVFLRDRSAVMLTFVVPIALVTVFGWIMTYAFGGGSGMPKVSLWIVDNANSEQSHAMIDSLRQSAMLRVLPDGKGKPITDGKLRTMINDGDAHHGIVFPTGYGTADANGQSIDILLIRDPGREMEDRMIQIGMLQSTFSSGPVGWNAMVKRVFKNQGIDGPALDAIEKSMRLVQSSVGDAIIEQRVAAKASEGNSSEPSESSKVSVESKVNLDALKFLGEALATETEDIRPAARPKRVTYQQAQSVSGMSVMMLLFSLTGAGALLLSEKDSGTLRRLFALPIARESVLLGKFMFIAVLGIFQMIVMFVYGELMFKVGLFRDPFTLAILIVSWVAAASGFAMFIATFTTSAKQADGLSTVLILVMAALGGCWFPLQMMDLPMSMVIATRSMMTYWAMDGFQSMLWNGLSIFDTKTLTAVGIQWIWAVALIGTAILLFRRTYLKG